MILLLIYLALAQEPVRIAVIDTGISPEAYKEINHCNKNLDKSFADEPLYDYNGHGTNIVGLIQKNAGNIKHCFIIIKVWGIKRSVTNDVYLSGLDYASKLDVDIINLSGGGYGFNQLEKNIIKKYLNKGRILINASGNDARHLSKDKCDWYPGCYDNRIIVVGNKAESSNYGPRINMYLNGNNQEGFGITLSGSSQSAAIFTGMAVKLWKIKKNSSK
jgi:subtilisin family serine protease